MPRFTGISARCWADPGDAAPGGAVASRRRTFSARHRSRRRAPEFRDSTPRIRARKAWRWRARRSSGGQPYAMAFVDMRMPPGWDGLKTIEELWKVDPDVQVVICSAHTDYDWSEVVRATEVTPTSCWCCASRPNPSRSCSAPPRSPASGRTSAWCATRWSSLEEVINVRTRGLEAANRQLRHLATHDALTGLPNRVLLDDRLNAGDGARRPRWALLRADGVRSRPIQARQRFARDTARAMSCCRRSRAACRAWCARPIPWRASAAMSSCC